MHPVVWHMAQSVPLGQFLEGLPIGGGPQNQIENESRILQRAGLLLSSIVPAENDSTDRTSLFIAVGFVSHQKA